MGKWTWLNDNFIWIFLISMMGFCIIGLLIIITIEGVWWVNLIIFGLAVILFINFYVFPKMAKREVKKNELY